MTSKQINIKYMSDEALSTLRTNINEISEYLANNPEDNSWIYTISLLNDIDIFIEKDYQIDDFELEIPQNSEDTNIIIKNAIILYEKLKDLPQNIVADERFWNWLNFTKGYKVALKYMPISNTKNSIFKDHWLFTQGQRRGLFFGVLSRSYYRTVLTYDETRQDPYELTRFALEKQERIRTLTWRAYSSQRKLVKGAIQAIIKLNHLIQKENTKIYTELAKEISKLGSVKLLDIMSEEEIKDFVFKKLIDLYYQEG